MNNQNKTPKRLNIKKLFGNITLWVIVAVGIGYIAGSTSSNQPEAEARSYSSYDDLRVFAEVLAIVQNQYVEKKDTKELAEGAIRGMIAKLDPHSAYMTVDSYKSRRQETQGKFGGLGIEITVVDGYVGIVAPIADTPAEAAGLMAGDVIVEIEKVSTKGMPLTDAVKLMRGKVNTDITITIYRETTDKRFDVTITRAVIKIRSVRYQMVDEEVGYVRLSTFSQDSGRDLRSSLLDLRKQGMKRLVLDLRNNPGGLLKQAVEVCDLFLPEGNTIVSTRGRTPEQNSRYVSHDWGEQDDLPMVVLINAGSASASEIVAGAMKDLKRAVIVGERSFGKGSVQTIRMLSDGSGLSLTTARYYTPSDTLIHGIGIAPDVKVALKLLDEDGDVIELPEPFREKDLMKRFNHEKVERKKVVQKQKVKKAKAGKKEKKKKRDLTKPRKLFNLEKDNQLVSAIKVLRQINGGSITSIPKL